ncbi:hypothetical protein [Streptomyces sp. NPDC005322]|uniref:hypothetical protein n=1 Tax=Streptomyces sp. NPDC005322 TaxID=3157032 RepID=UPI0033B654DE
MPDTSRTRARIHDALTRATAHGRLTLDAETIATVCDVLTAELAPQPGPVASHGPHSPSGAPEDAATPERAGDGRTDIPLPDFIEIAKYRLGRDGRGASVWSSAAPSRWPAWAARCWGDGPCDGWVSLDHHTEQSAQRWVRRHLAEDHPDTGPDTGPCGPACAPGHTYGLSCHADPDSTADADRTSPGDELTADEARALVDELGRDLYRAQDALAFVREMCVIADRHHAAITTADVRTWLKGPRCGRQLLAEAQQDTGLDSRTDSPDSTVDTGTDSPATSTDTVRTTADTQICETGDTRTCTLACPEHGEPNPAGRCAQHPNAPVIGGMCGACTIHPADFPGPAPGPALDGVPAEPEQPPTTYAEAQQRHIQLLHRRLAARQALDDAWDRIEEAAIRDLVRLSQTDTTKEH